MSKKILFLGSKPIGHFCLQYLIDNQSNFKYEIVGALTNDNKIFGNEYSISNLCKKYDLKIIDDLEDILGLEDIDFIISIQYHKILKPRHIRIANKLAINLHMAPLPEYRGCNQYSFAIYNEEKEFGTTIHRLEEGIDSGAIISERRFKIKSNENVESLYLKTLSESKILFKDSLPTILNQNHNLISQEKLKNKNSRFYKRSDIDSLKIIDLNSGEEEILRRVNSTAMPGFEQPYAYIDGQKYYIIPERNLKL